MVRVLEAISHAVLRRVEAFERVSLLHLAEVLLEAAVRVEQDRCSFHFQLRRALIFVLPWVVPELYVERVELVEGWRPMTPPRPFEFTLKGH